MLSVSIGYMKDGQLFIYSRSITWIQNQIEVTTMCLVDNRFYHKQVMHCDEIQS